MRPRRCTQGLSLLLLLLFSWAFVLDDMAVLLAAALLLCGLIGVYIHFDRRFREIVLSAGVERSLERTQVRKGATLQVVTNVTVRIPPGMEIAVRENLAPGIAVQDGITSFTAGPADAPVVQKMSYRITPVVHGEFAFPGIVLSAKDRFFETDITLSAGPFRGPSLFVQPTGLFEAGTRRITAETREIEKMGVLSGFGIRALREYYAGDDMRKIDWKQTAKYNKIFVREYTGMMNLPPLIIIDLPWRGDKVSESDFNRMVAAVAGLAEHAIKNFQFVSVLLISGPNILSFIAEEKDLERCMTTLRRWMHPVERINHLYRMADRSDLRGRIRTIDTILSGEPGPEDARFLALLRKNYQAGQQEQRMLAFTGQVIRTIGQITADEIYVFSLGIRGHEPSPAGRAAGKDDEDPGPCPVTGAEGSGCVGDPPRKTRGRYRGGIRMSALAPDRVILVLMAAVVILSTLIRPGPAGYLAILLVVVFAITYRLTRTWPDRVFYLVCSGILLVAISGAASVWEGLVLAWMAAGVIATVMEIHVSAQDLPALLVAGSVTLAITLMIELANHVLLPLAILCGITGCVLAVMAIRDYRFRKQYSGVPV